MTESQSPLDAALDLLLYAPVGLALTAAEEIPKLATKGRSQLEGQLTMARVVGQFAVAQGRKELKKRLNPPPATTRRPGSAAPGARSASASRPLAPESPANRSRPAGAVVGDVDLPVSAGSQGAGPDAGARRAGADAGARRAGADAGARRAGPRCRAGAEPAHAGAGPGGTETVGAETVGTGPGPFRTATTSGGEDTNSFRPVARNLAIPGYDSLAASQVVQRLAGLSKDELEAVGAYEAAHRSRRTILTRIRQLQGS